MTVATQIETTFREEHGRVLAALISQLGDFTKTETTDSFDPIYLCPIAAVPSMRGVKDLRNILPRLQSVQGVTAQPETT